ncbi:Mur ligase domain-containing protein [Eubacteriales bacterium OttesenSCG-928-N14]|nr:Mur ligase domain-containing protein [Eubacteriales bacterium OttesenSCG-928-N14]
MAKLNLNDYQGKRIHFVGIGGSSMHGLADMLRQQGFVITGSDIKEAVFTPYLRSVGIPFTVGHSEENVAGADLVVYTAAVKPDNVELHYAKVHGIPTIERSELLGEMLKNYDTVIAIAGCHGKTTISSMVGLILMRAYLDPTIHIGGSLNYLEHGGTHLGKGNTFVLEACEYLDSFLHFLSQYRLNQQYR